MRFHAAIALEKVLRMEVAMKFIRGGLDILLKTYLQLMGEFDNEELIAAFENIMGIFEDEIRPYAVDISNHLRNMYQRCIAADQEAGGDDWGESILAACGAVQSMRRIIDGVQEDVPLLQQIEKILYPVLLHTLTPDGLDSIEEGIESITMLIYYGYKNGTQVSPEMWKLYPQMLYVVAGSTDNKDGGYGIEYSQTILGAIKNFISKDPKNMLCVGAE